MAARKSAAPDRKPSAAVRRRRHTADAHHPALDVLMKFRLIVNSAKRHFQWVERQCGISGAQLWVLWELQGRPGLRVTELAHAMAVHQSTLSNLVETLARAGLLRRERDDADRRVVRLVLTAAGARLLRRAPRPARGMLAEAMHALPRAQLSALDGLLQRVLDAMQPAGREAMRRPLSDLLAPDET